MYRGWKGITIPSTGDFACAFEGIGITFGFKPLGSEVHG
jgi:hypothetical protein